jgi:lipopolysaccharide export system protein LptC
VTIAPMPIGDTRRLRRPIPSRRIPRPARLVARAIARRRWFVGLTKRALPLGALALLASVALWPELARDTDRSRMSYRRGAAVPESGQMVQASYHGVDANGRPYTMTATTAHQVDPNRINLTEPKGDITLESGSWLMAQSHRGVYLQHEGSLDLWEAVHLYRDDGTTMDTSVATLDLKVGAAAGPEQVHSEGPFGTLDAQGFAVTDRGAVIQFTGPGRLVLNSASGHPKPVAEPPPGTAEAPPPPP